jgi:DNA-directed RNA polymerase I, II, and III subunit RPABC1
MQKIINTILEMFEQRGYSDIKQNEEYITANDTDNNIIRVNLNIIQKLNIAEINSIVHNLQDNNISHCIVIFQGIPTPSVKNLILSLPELNLNIELFKAEDLFFNITKHILVPNHEKLNKQEQIQFKKSFGINIPVLLKTDPISKFYNFKRGDIIKVTRKNGFISYRIVK